MYAKHLLPLVPTEQVLTSMSHLVWIYLAKSHTHGSSLPTGDQNHRGSEPAGRPGPTCGPTLTPTHGLGWAAEPPRFSFAISTVESTDDFPLGGDKHKVKKSVWCLVQCLANFNPSTNTTCSHA
jgi:hypothetical protein